MANAVKRTLLGRPMHSTSLGETLLRKRIALPVFCSDPLSSVAYATEQILLVLVIGGTTLLAMTGWVAAAVAALLALVVWSYRQTVRAYPNGGGAYVVSKENLGVGAALVAASALMVDYVLTVAVSVTAGVANVVSAFPGLADWLLPISLIVIVLLAIMNLRGVKEAGNVFAIPTYGFIASVFLLLAVAAFKTVSGSPVVAATADLPVIPIHEVAGIATVLLLLRAFASGCTALTGVEAISNGVPFFRVPKSKNAAITLLAMGIIAVTMFWASRLWPSAPGRRLPRTPRNWDSPPGPCRTRSSPNWAVQSSAPTASASTCCKPLPRPF